MREIVLETRIRAARVDEAESVSALALRSKAYWGYPAEFMAACREELTYSEAQLGSPEYEFQVCEIDGRVAGFYALVQLGGEETELEALFVEPEWIGRGVGRALIEHAKSTAASQGMRRMIIQGDPHTTAFYEAAGGVNCGQRESGSIAGRFLPLFRIDL